MNLRTSPSDHAGADRKPELTGESMAIRAVRRAIDRVAPTDAPVLITGETGTGKELVARLVHGRSRCCEGPFVSVNCPALPAELFQAEVFGHEKGAFTGASQRSLGRIGSAEGGTLFLDEIGDLPMNMQVILLRFLAEGVYERLGSVEPIQSNVRIIAATHTDLESACATGRFRPDLYYRLNALRIHTPPLRDRGTDVILMARQFLAEFTTQLGMRPHELGSAALEALVAHDWPGNVRELRNRILQALVMCEQATLDPRNLGLDASSPASGQPRAMDNLRDCRRTAERDAILRSLAASGDCVEEAAARLEISRAQLYRLMKSHGIVPASTRPAPERH